jgi:hypothetical protein
MAGADDGLSGIDQQRLDARRAQVEAEIHIILPCQLFFSDLEKIWLSSF